MKKVISILLALIMALSLCACDSGTNTSTSTEETTSIKDVIIGSWECEYLYTSNGETKLGTYTITFFPGGTGKTNGLDMTWEVVDGVINTQYPNGIQSFTYSPATDHLTMLQKDRVYERVSN